jgi:hypothetical protein
VEATISLGRCPKTTIKKEGGGVLGAARGARRTRAAAVRDRLTRPYPMPDHDGRPPRARERVDATAPARKRAFRDAEFVESHDENLSAEASRDQSCSPTWSVVSLSELTSRASSPALASCSSVVAAAALEDEEDEEEGDPGPRNGPPSPRETNVKKRRRRRERKKKTPSSRAMSSSPRRWLSRRSRRRRCGAPSPAHTRRERERRDET